MNNMKTVGSQLVEEPKFPFSIEEYKFRLEKVRRIMADSSIDTLFVTAPDNICYISGYQNAWYMDRGPKWFYPASGIAIQVDSDNFIHFEDHGDDEVARYTAISTDIRTPVGDMDMKDFIVESLKKMGWLKGTVALEFWSYRPNRGYSELFQAALEKAGATVIDGSDIFNDIKKNKSEKELEFILKAAKIADIGMRAAFDAIKPGVMEIEVYGAAAYAMASAGGENPGIPNIVLSGPKNHFMHGAGSRRKIRQGDIVNIDMCGVFNRYHANIVRSIAVGEPPDNVLKKIEKTNSVYNVVSEIIRPEMRIAEMIQRAERVAREEGIWDDRVWIGGYELGIAFPPDWVGNYCFDSEIDSGAEVLEPGFVANHMFNFTLPDNVGLRMLGNTMVVTDERAEFINNYPIEVAIVD